MNFALYDADGVIHNTGVCPDGRAFDMIPLGKGWLVFEGQAELHDRIDVATGALVKGVEPEKTYRQLRQYPSLETQLDALWHAMDQGDLPMAPEFYDMIKRVKDKHPNPNGVKRVEE